MTSALAQLRHLFFRVFDIAEGDGGGWASLLAGGHDLTWLDLTPLLVGRDMRRLDALRAIGAFFHDAARPHGHVGIVRGHALLVAWPIVVPVEPSHLVRAVAGTGTGADAAVIDLLVDAFRAVHGGVDRAPHLAGRFLAMHARDRLEIAARILDIAGVVAVDAQPQHLAADFDLLLADDQHIVLDVAGRDASIAADAPVEIDHHAPGVFGGLPLRIKTWLRVVRGQRRLLRADLLYETEPLHAVMKLRRREVAATLNAPNPSSRQPWVL